MFKPVSMKSVNLFILENDTKKVTELLYDLKFIEFFKLEKENFNNYKQEDISELTSKLLRLRSTITILKKYSHEDTKIINKETISNPIEKTQKLKEREETTIKEILNIKDEIKRNKVLTKLNLTNDELKRNDLSIGFISEKDENLLQKLTYEKIKYRKYHLDERIYFCAYSNKIPFSFKEFYLPKSPVITLISKLPEKEKDITNITKELKNIANTSLRHLQVEELKLSKEIATLEAKKKFAKTENISVISGHMPVKFIKKLKINLEKILSDKYELEINKPDKDAPVLLNNTGASNNFETLLKMYSIPSYKEIDPTFIMTLIFPIFYGFILGDVGYGILSLIAFTLAKKKFYNIKQFISVLQLSSISSIIFGIFYGEYFGFEPYTPLLSRIHDPNSLLIAALIFGAIHINLGVLIGFINKLDNIKEAICDKLSWIILEFGCAFLALGIFYKTIELNIIGGFIILLSMLLIYLGHGFIGIIEIPSFFTNIFSYARLMAVGLSSVVIALLVNQFSIYLFQLGFIGIIFGVIAFTIGHIFNIILGNFESFLHTLRLHYVEFFTKFYTGGGKEFEPFGEKNHENY